MDRHGNRTCRAGRAAINSHHAPGRDYHNPRSSLSDIANPGNVLMWNKSKAVEHLNSKAQPHSLGQCAAYVRRAVEAGGVTLQHHVSAKDYGSSLLHVGFNKIVGSHASAQYHHLAGDVAVIQPIEGHRHGHMTMFNGKEWVSDFVQHHGLYPGHSYRLSKPPYAIYRYPF